MENREFEALMRQYQKLVYTVCYRFVQNPETAQDLTQDTFLSAYAGIDRCDPAYYKQWLIRVASNKCKDHLRSAWARKVDATEDEALESIAGPPGPEQEYIAQEGENEVRRQIETLREPYGQVASLYFLQEVPVARIAVLLGRPEKTVQNQVFRAKNLLRQQLSERRQV